MNAPASGRHQRGAAALVVTSLLGFALLLGVAGVNRSLLVEQRASANQARSAQAFEAAEAGLDWALARLNDATRLGADCLPSAAAEALSFRERFVQIAAAGGAMTPATWNDAGTARPLSTACVRGAAGWDCSCPASGPAVLPVPSDSVTRPAFSVSFLSGPRPGLVRIVADGCMAAGGTCSAATADHEAGTRVEATFALLPAFRSAPAAALTVRGDLDAGAAALGLHNDDAESGGLAVQAGGRIAGSGLRLSAPAGSPLTGSLASADAAFAGLDADRFFARFFGMSPSAWTRQPAALRLACPADCTPMLQAAVAAGHHLIAIDGDLDLRGPAAFGTTDAPIALVATGAVRLQGAVALSGIVHGAGSLRWDDAAGPGASVRGAALTAGNYGGDSAADIVRDDAVLARLQSRVGSFVRVNGSWKDF